MNLDLSKLTFLPANLMPELQDAMNKYQINTPLRAAHFLAQTKHESGNFTHTTENLNYSSDRLKIIFKKYFPDDAIAQAYARQPEKIANRVYANRMGNGDEKSGDGWKYRGRGYIQLTGKNNQTKFISTCSESILPEQISEPKYAIRSAAWFFQKNGLNTISDEGGSDATIQKVTKIINNGLNGITERIENFHAIFPLIKAI